MTNPTQITASPALPFVEARDGIVALGMEIGVNEGYSRLDEILSTPNRTRRRNRPDGPGHPGLHRWHESRHDARSGAALLRKVAVGCRGAARDRHQRGPCWNAVRRMHRLHRRTRR